MTKKTIWQIIAEKYAAYKLKRNQRRIENLITEAERLRDLTGYRYIVFRYKNRLRMATRVQLKKMISRGAFTKGVTIEMLEKQAVYITKYSKESIPPVAKVVIRASTSS